MLTIGHRITLICATDCKVSRNHCLVAAVITLSVLYKAFDDNVGFQKCCQMALPNLLWAVYGIGLLHGFGLSTRLQH